MKDKLQWAVVVVASMALGAASIAGIDALRTDEAGAPAAVESPAAPDNGGAAPAVARTANDIADLVEEIRPNVVLISTSSARAGGSGIGSGVILDRDGHILTNNHVVAGSNTLDVTLSDGTVGAARVIGRDPGNDLAIIKVDIPADKLHPARLGNSDTVRLGELVVAIGNPFGRTGSVSEGIVSGVDRTLSGGVGRPLRALIQTDAAINPGNSGGGLFNARGEVIGITTAIENPSGDRVFAGIGYAVPINIAQNAMAALRAGQTIQHPRLGIAITDLTPALANSLGVPAQQGLIITQVETNSAASKAGLRAGRNGQGADVIISIDGTPIKNYDDLAKFLDSRRVGDAVQVKIIREGKEMNVLVTLEAWQDNSA